MSFDALAGVAVAFLFASFAEAVSLVTFVSFLAVLALLAAVLVPGARSTFSAPFLEVFA